MNIQGQDSLRWSHFKREEWVGLASNGHNTLAEDDLLALLSLNDPVSVVEVAQIYGPVSDLLDIRTRAASDLHDGAQHFLERSEKNVPFIVGIAGSVAAGKSTTARVLQALMQRWEWKPSVGLVTTDGFLYPNAVLEERGIMGRKGFPESYDRKRLIDFLTEIKGGLSNVQAPVYSHTRYDILADETQVVNQPDVLIVEGLNVLQTGEASATPFVSDFFDYSIYVDAAEEDLEHWYVERFFALRATAFQKPDSFFRHYAELSNEAAHAVATEIWRSINLVNLHENILPTRERARMILEKGHDHSVQSVRLAR